MTQKLSLPTYWFLHGSPRGAAARRLKTGLPRSRRCAAGTLHDALHRSRLKYIQSQAQGWIGGALGAWVELLETFGTHCQGSHARSGNAAPSVVRSQGSRSRDNIVEAEPSPAGVLLLSELSSGTVEHGQTWASRLSRLLPMGVASWPVPQNATNQKGDRSNTERRLSIVQWNQSRLRKGPNTELRRGGWEWYRCLGAMGKFASAGDDGTRCCSASEAGADEPTSRPTARYCTLPHSSP